MFFIFEKDADRYCKGCQRVYIEVMETESTRQNLPQRLREYSEISKTRPHLAVLAPICEAAEEIEHLRELLSQAHGDLATIAAEATPDETSERLVAVYRSIAEAAMKRYLDARWAWRNL
jgi:hypothetical protein